MASDKKYKDLELNSPITFSPILKKRVWGGRNLENLFGKKLPDDEPYGESWEISDRKEGISLVNSGQLKGKTLNELWNDKILRDHIFGLGLVNQVDDNSSFPVLLKILDCNKDLSIQVHPPKKIAEKYNLEQKNEFWYISHANKKSKILAGVTPGVTKENLLESIKEGNVEKNINELKSKKDHYIYLHSGRVHSIGEGNIIFEIQQNSNTTFRVYDWQRKGLSGKPRKLHINEALESIDFGDVNPELLPAKNGNLNTNESFSTSLIELNNGDKYFVQNFAIFAVIEGEAISGDLTFNPGSFFMIAKKSNPSVKTLKSNQKGTKLLKITLTL